MDLPREILELLKKKAAMSFNYTNPNFLEALKDLLYTYYDLEDENVNNWIREMWES